MMWLFVAIGVATFALRASFIVVRSSSASPRFDTLRRFVPVAALTALIVPALFTSDHTPDLTRTVAIAVAAIVARRGNVLLTVVAGMAVLTALRVVG